jgi:S-adenosylmethionine:tRNA ribosyltransferase-isomerase
VRLSDFNYHLPDECIAQTPLADRAASRMLVLHRREQRWEDRAFRDLPEYIAPGDCLVFNDSRVFPSRLFGHRGGVHSLPIGKNNPKRFEHLSARIEVFLLRAVSEDHRSWEALVRPGRKLPIGERVLFDHGITAEIIARGEYGERTLRFEIDGDVYEALERIGHVPLPPYIHRPDSPQDRERYQTIFARETGSVAAPTAGLHFTPEIISACQARGAELASVTLHVGLGTFQPIHTEVIEEHTLHTERYQIPAPTLQRLDAAKRVLAVGTTSVRTLESFARTGAQSGDTNIFLYPGCEFLRTDALLTNFHLPQSSLLILVSAFAGREFVLSAYAHAVESGYRFFSYGDCMLIVN